jgi:hypothetical protein
MSRHHDNDVAAQPWTGATRRYDIVKEGVIAIVVVGVLALALSALFSSPDDPALTFKGWATSNPNNFYATTVNELGHLSESGAYGPPYNSGDGLNTGPIRMQKWMGVRIPVDSAQDFVITPLSTQQQPTQVTAALSAWNAATVTQRDAWAAKYADALAATATDAAPDGVPTQVPPSADYGPVPTLALGLLFMARSGAYDGVLMAQGNFYQTDYTKQILFLGDGSYLDDAATAAHLQGNTWGMMNETGSFPGQAWLWLYSFWYQLPQFNVDEAVNPDDYLTTHADAVIFYIMAFLTLLLLLLPFIPGLRSIPRWIPIHRLIWRDYYRKQRAN